LGISVISLLAKERVGNANIKNKMKLGK